MELIPGLPNDIALECLIRVPYNHFSSVSLVSQTWKTELESPGFRRHRKSSGLTRSIIVMAQARFGPYKIHPWVEVFGLLRSITSRSVNRGQGWSDLPPIPGLLHGLPMFCQFAGVGSDLVVLGGWDPATWEASKAVFVYNFLSGQWRAGSDMPGSPRSFFACASDSYRLVLVAGGHDNEKNALKSAMAYDVANDKWVPLPDMARERDECKAVFQHGKFHVIGGYATEMQGRFEKSAETFDLSTWQWGPVEDNFLENATCPRTCVASDKGKIYMCRGSDLAILQNDTWQAVTQLPTEVRCSPHLTIWEDKLLVIGSEKFGAPHVTYVLNLERYTWTRIATPDEYSGINRWPLFLVSSMSPVAHPWIFASKSAEIEIEKGPKRKSVVTGLKLFTNCDSEDDARHLLVSKGNRTVFETLELLVQEVTRCFAISSSHD
ncbi:Kelch repeat type 1 [Dillenia turbinata]|uniref:Kelch repeat type 1 n=1 Tax=Dillenia turbinata TaxID=194707 RepID=A0AAN8UI06_9MAGN